MTTILKLFSIETLMTFIGEYLKSTIKNKDGEKAKRIVKAVRALHQITSTFLGGFQDDAARPTWPFQE